MTQEEKYIKEHNLDEIDAFLMKEFGIMAGCCSAQKSLEYNVARQVAEKLWKHEQSVSDDLEEASKNYAFNNTPWDDCKDEIQESFKAGAQWQKTKDESITEDLGEYLNELSKQFPEVSFAKLSRIGVRVAKWQKEHLLKPADGDDLPEIDREVISLLNNGKVVFAHRPSDYWDGKNIDTGKVTRYYPKTYDKGGWNIPDVKYWIDVKLPKEIEL